MKEKEWPVKVPRPLTARKGEASMDMIQLRYFLKTAQTLNYSHAAESLFISRQSLRQTLGNLEKELGQDLFVNDHNHLSLTEYGEYLVLASQELVDRFDRMERDVARFFRQSVTLQVAFSMSLFPYHLPDADPILQDFQTQHPHIVLDIRRLTADQIIDQVEAGELDCGVVLQMPTSRPGCAVTSFRPSGVAIGLSPDSPLCDRKEITLEELAQVPLAAMGSLEKIARPLWEDCRRRGITLNCQIVPDTITALYLARNGQTAVFNTYQAGQAQRPLAVPPSPKAVIPGYTWEVAALCPRTRPNHNAAQLLASFLREKYR